jgi:digalactosyldiacylglycerol synthase
MVTPPRPAGGGESVVPAPSPGTDGGGLGEEHADGPAAGLRAPGRHFLVVTTASLPWLTGTAVNPTLRAAYLARGLPRSRVALALPWLPPPAQGAVFPPALRFASPADQERYVRAWLLERTGFAPGLDIVFYPARYCPTLKSIFPYGDLTALMPPSTRDVAVLEEPEHLTWFHSGPRWTDAYKCVVGVAHTNYGDYIRALRGSLAAATATALNRALVAVHTHAVVRLSAAVPPLPRAATCNVHGVARGFLTAGRGGCAGEGAYYIGKALWAKGYADLLRLLTPGAAFKRPPRVDAYGSGEDADAFRAAAAAAGAPIDLADGRDHLHPSLRHYRVFVNPSTSDVVATTSAEALALGRWLVCPVHPCNEFFSTFTACLRYSDEAGFAAALTRALAEPPPQLTRDERRALTWAAATRRFLDAAEPPRRRRGLTGAASEIGEAVAHRAYGAAMRLEAARRLLGAGAWTRIAPAGGAAGFTHGGELGPPDADEEHGRLGYPRARYVG